MRKYINLCDIAKKERMSKRKRMIERKCVRERNDLEKKRISKKNIIRQSKKYYSKDDNKRVNF